MTPEPTAIDLDVLRATRALTDEVPWNQRALIGETRGGEISYCLLGMLGKAQGMTNQEMQRTHHHRYLAPVGVFRALREVIAEQYPEWEHLTTNCLMQDSEAAWSWNDQVAQSVEEVQRVIDKAITKLEEQV